jgi:hypothetical protein
MTINQENLLTNGRCPYCGMRPIVGEGRHIGLSTTQIEGVLRHYNAPQPKITQQQYCQQEKIGLKSYWRVTHLRLKHPNDRAKIIAVANSIGFDIVHSKACTHCKEVKI